MLFYQVKTVNVQYATHWKLLKTYHVGTQYILLDLNFI